MGADLLLHHVWIRRGRTPDWAAAKATLAAMTDEDVERLEEFEYRGDTPAEYREFLIRDLGDIEEAWNSDRRLAYKFPAGPIDMWVTGGVSWGDSPTDEFDTVGRLLETNALEAAGFYDWPRCAEVDCSGPVVEAGTVYCDDHNGRVPMVVG